MKKIFTILFLITAFLSKAQNNLDKITGLSSTTASVAYSLRQLSNGYTGPLVRIKVGASFYDVYPDQSTTKFSLSSKISASISTYNAAVSAAGVNALSTIISGSTDATVAIWYDQSGNGVDVLSSSAAAQIISLGTINTINGQPTIFFNSTGYLVSSSTVDYSAQVGATVNAVVQNVATTSNVGGIIGTAYIATQPGYGIAVDATFSNGGFYSDGAGGGWYTGVLTTSPKILTDIFLNNSNTSSNFYVNGVLKSTSASAVGPIYPLSGSRIYIGRARGYSGFDFNGYISEALIFPNKINTSEQLALETSQSIFVPQPPSVTITSSASGTICAGTSVTFTATTTGISSPTYQWTKNGIGIPGANSSTYTTTTLSNNDVIKVWVNAGINPSSIVSNGLLLNIDASNPGSYAGTGNNWYDLSGNNNHATLMNSPTYDAASGSIVTNGTNQYISIPQVSTANTNITMQAWVYVNLNTTGTFIKNGTGGGGYSIGIGNWAYDQVGSNVVMLLYGRGWIGSGVSYGTAGWKLVTLTLDGSSTAKAYVNGSLIGTYTWPTPTSPSGPLNLGANIGDGNIYYNGKFAAAYFYNRELSLAEIQQNYNAFATKTTAYGSNSITVSISGSTPTLTVSGDACVNKTTLSTTSGLTAYAWYKDDVAISGATSNSYTPSTTGSYKVLVTTGSCSSTSTSTTIYACAVSSSGQMVATSYASSIISPEGGANFGTGRDYSGKLYNTIGLTTTSGTIGSSTAVLGGIISPTNSVTTSIGVIYSTDINFGTYSSTTIQSNAAAGSYSNTITGLASSTNYFAKSFIVNKAGTSYGSVINFTTSSPPITMNSNSAVSNIGPYSASISGSIASAGGSSIVASGICYSFSNQTPTVNDSKTTDGTSSGNYVSSLTGLTQGTTYYARAYATNSQGTEYGNQVSFTTLGTVTSPYTAKVWMDRNLGATQAATSINDGASYGDLYQWGRANDGGQLRTAPNTPTQLATYTTQSTYYITTQPWTSDANWNTKTGSVWNQQPWNNTDGGVNNPCPSGFRVPTTSEWTAELNGMINAGLVTNSNTATNIASGAFSSFLKIPQAGVIENRNTTLITTKTVFWTTDRLDSYSANEIRFWPTQGAYQNANWYSFRYSVRCIAK